MSYASIQHGQAPSAQSLSVAIWPGLGLGDGLLLLGFAHGLQLIGFDVVIYHPKLVQLSALLPAFRFKDYQGPSAIIPVLERHDFHIFNHCVAERMDGSVLVKHLGKYSVVFCGGLLNKRHALWHVCNDMRETTHSNEVLCQLVKHGGVSLTRNRWRAPVVTAVHRFCKYTLGICHVPKMIPHAWHCTPKQTSNVIMIHPDSSIYKKNWHPKKYLKLAAKLEHDGYRVVFAVSVDEFERWDAIICQQFLLTKWCLLEAARHMYNAVLFVGSDSGLGHLASLLGTPTVTVFVRKRRYYAWRPGWAKSYIAEPFVKINFIKAKHHLRSALGVNRVFMVCKRALAENQVGLKS